MNGWSVGRGRRALVAATVGLVLAVAGCGDDDGGTGSTSVTATGTQADAEPLVRPGRRPSAATLDERSYLAIARLYTGDVPEDTDRYCASLAEAPNGVVAAHVAYCKELVAVLAAFGEPRCNDPDCVIAFFDELVARLEPAALEGQRVAATIDEAYRADGASACRAALNRGALGALVLQAQIREATDALRADGTTDLAALNRSIGDITDVPIEACAPPG